MVSTMKIFHFLTDYHAREVLCSTAFSPVTEASRNIWHEKRSAAMMIEQPSDQRIEARKRSVNPDELGMSAHFVIKSVCRQVPYQLHVLVRGLRITKSVFKTNNKNPFYIARSLDRKRSASIREGNETNLKR